jgi:hypothetical protein
MVDVGRAIRFALDIWDRNGQSIASHDLKDLAVLGPAELGRSATQWNSIKNRQTWGAGLIRKVIKEANLRDFSEVKENLSYWGKKELIGNQRALGRKKDHADLEALGVEWTP